MGNCLHRDSGESEKQAAQALKARREELAREHKVLLLGPGESGNLFFLSPLFCRWLTTTITQGKSTIFKQMRILLQQGYTKEELMEFRETVYVNIIKNMKSLVDAVKRFNYPYASESNEACWSVAKLRPKLHTTLTKKTRNEEQDWPSSRIALCSEWTRCGHLSCRRILRSCGKMRVS